MGEGLKLARVVRAEGQCFDCASELENRRKHAELVSVRWDGLDISVSERHACRVDTSDKCSLGAEMDTSQQRAVIPRDKEVSVASLRQRSIAEIVEESKRPKCTVLLSPRMG